MARFCGGAHRAREVDRLGRLEPRRRHRRAQHVDRLAGAGERVAGVEQRPVAGGHDVPGVVEARQVGVDHGVQLADGAYVEAGVELLAGRDDRDPLAPGPGASERIRSATAPIVKTGASAARRWSTRKWSGCSWVMSTAVAPSTASGPVQTPGIDHQRHALVLDPDARVPELRDPHPANVRGARSRPDNRWAAARPGVWPSRCVVGLECGERPTGRDPRHRARGGPPTGWTGRSTVRLH